MEIQFQISTSKYTHELTITDMNHALRFFFTKKYEPSINKKTVIC